MDIDEIKLGYHSNQQKNKFVTDEEMKSDDEDEDDEHTMSKFKSIEMNKKSKHNGSEWQANSQNPLESFKKIAI